MTTKADIVVIGGGIIGCSVVFHLTRVLPRDTRILLLERGAIAGATSGSCMGHLMVTPDDQSHYALSAASVRLWRELHQEVGGFDYRPTGALYLADAEDDLPLLHTLQAQFAAAGDRADVLDGRELRAREPRLAPDLQGALFYAGDAVVLPMAACGAMLRAARSANPNVVVRPGTAVVGLDRAGDRVTGVRTADAAIPAGEVVIAAGVWTPAVAALVGAEGVAIVPRAGNLAITAHHTTPVHTQLLEVSYLRFAHGAAQVDPTRVGEDRGGHAVNLQPQTHGGCLIGSTRQFRGMDRTLDHALVRRSLARASRYVPALRDLPIVRTWVGLRPYSIDGRPWIGPWPRLRGLWLASGHEGLGISLAPITGLLLAQQIAGLPVAVDCAPWLPAGRVA
jgi:sarcosine oxidase subunit beta